MFIVSIVIAALLAFAFLASGGMKVAGMKRYVETFEKVYRYPRWFLTVTGLVEVVGAIAMVVGIWYPVVAVLAGAWLGFTMLVGIWTHLFRAHQPFSSAIAASVLALMSIAIIIINWPALTHVLLALH